MNKKRVLLLVGVGLFIAAAIIFALLATRSKQPPSSPADDNVSQYLPENNFKAEDLDKVFSSPAFEKIGFGISGSQICYVENNSMKVFDQATEDERVLAGPKEFEAAKIISDGSTCLFQLFQEGDRATFYFYDGTNEPRVLPYKTYSPAKVNAGYYALRDSDNFWTLDKSGQLALEGALSGLFTLAPALLGTQISYFAIADYKWEEYTGKLISPSQEVIGDVSDVLDIHSTGATVLVVKQTDSETYSANLLDAKGRKILTLESVDPYAIVATQDKYIFATMGEEGQQVKLMQADNSGMVVPLLPLSALQPIDSAVPPKANEIIPCDSGIFVRMGDSIYRLPASLPPKT